MVRATVTERLDHVHKLQVKVIMEHKSTSECPLRIQREKLTLPIPCHGLYQQPFY